ncbi:hypothetical protein MASR1M68_07500 [Elusimicrobiota bacterium]
MHLALAFLHTFFAKEKSMALCGASAQDLLVEKLTINYTSDLKIQKCSNKCEVDIKIMFF